MGTYKSKRRKGIVDSFMDGAERGRRKGLALRSVIVGVFIVVLTLATLVCCFASAIIAIGG